MRWALSLKRRNSSVPHQSSSDCCTSSEGLAIFRACVKVLFHPVRFLRLGDRWSTSGQPLHDGHGDWDHFNFIFPDYLKLMTGFPSFHPDDGGAEFLH